MIWLDILCALRACIHIHVEVRTPCEWFGVMIPINVSLKRQQTENKRKERERLVTQETTANDASGLSLKHPPPFSGLCATIPGQKYVYGGDAYDTTTGKKKKYKMIYMAVRVIEKEKG